MYSEQFINPKSQKRPIEIYNKQDKNRTQKKPELKRVKFIEVVEPKFPQAL
jgi:hypothetical protein